MSAATPCKYERGPCTFPKALRRHFKCQDGSCPEQAGRACSRADDETKPPIGETNQAAPETEREEVTVPPKKTGSCPKCGRDGVKIVANKFTAPEHPQTCTRCYATAWAAAKAKSKEAATGKAQATKAAKKASAPATSPASAPPRSAAPAKSRPAPIAQQRAAQAASGPVIQPPIPDDQRLSFTFRLTLAPGLTAGSLVEIVAELPAGAVLVG